MHGIDRVWLRRVGGVVTQRIANPATYFVKTTNKAQFVIRTNQQRMANLITPENRDTAHRAFFDTETQFFLTAISFANQAFEV